MDGRRRERRMVDGREGEHITGEEMSYGRREGRRN